MVPGDQVAGEEPSGQIFKGLVNQAGLNRVWSPPGEKSVERYLALFRPASKVQSPFPSFCVSLTARVPSRRPFRWHLASSFNPALVLAAAIALLIGF